MRHLLKITLDSIPPVSKKYAAAIACAMLVLFKAELQLDDEQIQDLVALSMTYVGAQAVVDTALAAKGLKKERD